MKRVEILWRDITHDGGWHEMDDLDKFINEDNVVRQLGYLYEDDENHVAILDSYFVNKELFGGIHRIPRGCIVEIKEF